MIFPRDEIVEITDHLGLSQLQRAIDRGTKAAWDTETTGLGWEDKPFMMTWHVAGQGFVIDKRRCQEELWRDSAQVTLAQAKRPLVGHHLLYDLLMGRKEFGLRYQGNAHCTMIQSFLLDENQSHRLKVLSEKRWPGSNALEQQVKDWLEEHCPGEPHYDQVPFELLSHYAVQDTFLTDKLDDVQRPLVNHLCESLYDTERELILVLADMRHEGIRLDIPYLEGLRESLASEAKLMEPQLFGLAGEEFDPMSSTELQRIFYEKLKEPVRVLTAGGKKGENKQPSTDKEALQAMTHPLGRLMLEYRDRQVSLNTFIKPWLEFADKDGYLHPELNQIGTRSGRFSSNNPNAQQIPKRSPSAKKLRRAFIYPEGSVGLSADQSQMEMVGFAHYSADPTMRQALIDGKDLHRVTAVEAGVAPSLEGCTSDHRRLGKGTNFSIVYGCGGAKLGSFLSQDMYAGRYVPTEEALDIRAKYHKRFPGVGAFTQRVIQTVRQRPDHTVKNMFGRVMHLSEDKAYVGVNRLIQSWAADAMKRSMVLAWRYARTTPDLRLNVNIHDDLKGHCSESRWVEHAQAFQKFLTDCPGLSVPIKVDLSFSRTSWAEEVEVKDFKVPVV